MQELFLSLKDLSVIDLQIIDSIRKISRNQNILANLVEIFLEDSPEKIAAILDASKIKNSKALYEAAHSLRSSSASIGAERLSKFCKFLEQQGRSDIVPDFNSVSPQLLKEYNEVKDNLLVIISQDEIETQF